MDVICLNEILAYEKLGFEVCRLLPEPFNKYASNFTKWIESAKREEPPGKCVLICSAIKSMVKQKSEYIEAALDLVNAESNEARASVLGLSGLVLCFIGQNEKGIQLLQDAFKLDSCSRFSLSLATELEIIGYFDESCELCAVLRDEPDNLEAKRILAENYLNKGDIKKAKKLISEVLIENPKDKKALRASSKMYFKEEKYKLAIAEYNKSIGFLEYDPYVIYHLARCYFATGNSRKSKRYLKKINSKAFEIVPYFRDNKAEIKAEMSRILQE